MILKYVNHTKIKGSCQSGRKVVTHNSKIALPLVERKMAPTCGVLGMQESLGHH